jgi:hypothetical protein
VEIVDADGLIVAEVSVLVSDPRVASPGDTPWT